MDGSTPVERSWFIRVAPEEAQIRCHYRRVKGRIVKFVVQLEIHNAGEWTAVVRYDNAHGFCHRDTLHPDGSQDKTGVFSGATNEVFTFAIEELRTNWESHRARYSKEKTP